MNASYVFSIHYIAKCDIAINFNANGLNVPHFHSVRLEPVATLCTTTIATITKTTSIATTVTATITINSPLTTIRSIISTTISLKLSTTSTASHSTSTTSPTTSSTTSITTSTFHVFLQLNLPTSECEVVVLNCHFVGHIFRGNDDKSIAFILLCLVPLFIFFLYQVN